MVRPPPTPLHHANFSTFIPRSSTLWSLSPCSRRVLARSSSFFFGPAEFCPPLLYQTQQRMEGKLLEYKKAVSNQSFRSSQLVFPSAWPRLYVSVGRIILLLWHSVTLNSVVDVVCRTEKMAERGNKKISMQSSSWGSACEVQRFHRQLFTAPHVYSAEKWWQIPSFPWHPTRLGEEI